MHRKTMALGALITGAILALCAPLAASAHDSLVSSDPASGSAITAVPDRFSVTMNEPLADLTGKGDGFAIEVRDSAGAYYGDGCFAIADATLSSGATLGPAGSYTLLWQVVSEDGHTASGEVPFTWAPADGAVISRGSTAAPVCGDAVPTPISADPGVTMSATPTPVAIAAPEQHPDASLGTVLWVGGGILALLVAGLVAVLVVTQRGKNKSR